MNKKLYTQKNNEDVEFGNNSENTNIKILNEHFKINLQQRKAYKVLDFIDENNKIIVELKSRRCYSSDHLDSMIGLNKLYNANKYINTGYSCYFAFSFCDKLCYYKYDGNINNSWIRMGGRYDRGKDEYNKYYHIPLILMKDIK